MSQNEQPGGGPLAAIVAGPHLRYLGLTLVLAWHYCLWFVPSSFPVTFLLDDRVTFAWLIALGAAGTVPLLLAWRVRRVGQLKVSVASVWLVGAVGSVATITLTSIGMMLSEPWIAYTSAFVVGACGGVMWMQWGERQASQRAMFTFKRVAPTFGGVLLALVGVTFVTPGWWAPAFVALLPLASSLLLHAHLREFTAQPPRLLPVISAAKGRAVTTTVVVGSFSAAYVCYYALAVVPWTAYDTATNGFTYGIAIGAALILLFGLLQRVRTRPASTFRVYPWLLLLVVVACVLFLADDRLQVGTFLLALAVASLFEILLTLYMGVLSRRGYVRPSMAFALSASAVRLGFALGNTTALVYERVPGWHDLLVRPTFVVLIVIVAGLLVTMVRQEYAMDELTRPPSGESELAAIVDQVAEEFQLSDREREIIALVGKGYTSTAVSEKLFISPHTVNTHVQNIYRKLGIHKRSELISYLQRDS
jgi:DNA-binding CsgD family transcriptional regulator